MKTNRFLGLVFFLLLAIDIVSVAQKKIIERPNDLNNAVCEYNNREYDSAQVLLNKVFKDSSRTLNDRIQAGELLMLYYMNSEIQREDLALMVAKKIVNLFPTFNRQTNDDTLNEIFSKLPPWQRITLGIFGGGNLALPHPINYYSVYQSNNIPDNKNYSSSVEFQIGVQLEYHLFDFANSKIFPQIYIQVSPTYRMNNYRRIDYMDITPNSNVTYTENLYYDDLAISTKIYFFKHRLKPYFQGGLYLTKLVNGTSTTEQDSVETLVNRTPYRFTGVQLGYSAGAGLSYSWERFSAFINFNYLYLPHLVNLPDARYEDQINTWKFYYVDDDFTLNNVQMNLGISYILKFRKYKI